MSVNRGPVDGLALSAGHRTGDHIIDGWQQNGGNALWPDRGAGSGPRFPTADDPRQRGRTRPGHGLGATAIGFGYLRTPRPTDASPEAQADAHVCLLDALGITRAAVMGVSAGAPSAMQTAIRHPQRVSALVLVMPIAYKPGEVVGTVPPVSDSKDELLLRLLGSDFLFWTGLQVAHDLMIRHVLATPPELVATASVSERTRVNALAERILPVSARAAGLRDDTRLGKGLKPYALASIQAPTLVVSARDDGFGTYAPAEYTASHIVGAKFLGFDQGGHLLVGHDETVRAAIHSLLKSIEQP